MSEEGAQPFMNPKQREALDRVDRFQLVTVLGKFCLKNCGVFKAMKEKTYVDLPEDCLKTCAGNVDRTYEKFTSSIKASLVQGEGAGEE